MYICANKFNKIDMVELKNFAKSNWDWYKYLNK